MLPVGSCGIIDPEIVVPAITSGYVVVVERDEPSTYSTLKSDDGVRLFVHLDARNMTWQSWAMINDVEPGERNRTIAALRLVAALRLR